MNLNDWLQIVLYIFIVGGLWFAFRSRDKEVEKALEWQKRYPGSIALTREDITRPIDWKSLRR